MERLEEMEVLGAMPRELDGRRDAGAPLRLDADDGTGGGNEPSWLAVDAYDCRWLVSEGTARLEDRADPFAAPMLFQSAGAATCADLARGRGRAVCGGGPFPSALYDPLLLC